MNFGQLKRTSYSLAERHLSVGKGGRLGRLRGDASTLQEPTRLSCIIIIILPIGGTSRRQQPPLSLASAYIRTTLR